MLAIRARVAELFTTACAFIRPFATMEPGVLQQVVFKLECLVTAVTFEWPRTAIILH
jgi:hypothetical protein